MLKFTDEEKQDVIDYYLGQSPEGTKVKFAQKVYVESVMGHAHSVWDIHASDGRWWVITNPTNLYSQDQFPNMDLAITFHIGLCFRIPRNDVKPADVERVRPFTDLMQSIQDSEAALGQANDAGAFRAIGVRCRENLLTFIHVMQDSCEWPEEGRPQRSNFNLWTDWIFDTLQGGADNRERRRLIKTTLKESWTFSNWLTHSQSATWIDAEIAIQAVSYSLGLATSVAIRQLREVPDACPGCGSHHLFPEEGMLEEAPEIIFERPTCAECGWQGESVPAGERTDEEIGQFITREGENPNDCGEPGMPLMNLNRPDAR